MAEGPQAAPSSVERFSLDAAQVRALRSDDPRDRQWLPAESSIDEPHTLTDLFNRLLITRVHQLFSTDVRVRAVEAAVGATLVGYGLTRARGSSLVVYGGVQTIRLSSGDALERLKFQIEPSISGGGFAIYVRKIM